MVNIIILDISVAKFFHLVPKIIFGGSIEFQNDMKHSIDSLNERFSLHMRNKNEQLLTCLING